MTIHGDFSDEKFREVLSVIHTHESYSPARMITDVYVLSSGEVQVFTRPGSDDPEPRWQIIYFCQPTLPYGYELQRLGYIT